MIFVGPSRGGDEPLLGLSDRVISKESGCVSDLSTPRMSRSWIVLDTFDALALLKKFSSNSFKTNQRSAQTKDLKRPSSFTLTMPSLTMDDEETLLSVCVRDNDWL